MILLSTNKMDMLNHFHTQTHYYRCYFQPKSESAAIFLFNFFIHCGFLLTIFDCLTQHQRKDLLLSLLILINLLI